MLDSHSQFAIPYESHFIPAYYANRMKFSDLSDNTRRLALVQQILTEPFVRDWDIKLQCDDIDLSACISLSASIGAVFAAYASKSGKPRWGDKTPAYLTELDCLNALFPSAYFVHIVRDGRDVALSWSQQSWGPPDFLSAIQLWERRLELGRKMLRMLPPRRWIEMRFEDLVANPRHQLIALTSFLEVPFEDQMVEGYRTVAHAKVGSQRALSHHSGLNRMPSSDQAFKWKKVLGAGDQSLASEVAGRLLLDLGYEASTHHSRTMGLRKVYHRAKCRLARYRTSQRTITPLTSATVADNR
jgi:hypothetical protein